jgi:hypothetical protein
MSGEDSALPASPRNRLGTVVQYGLAYSLPHKGEGNDYVPAVRKRFPHKGGGNKIMATAGRSARSNNASDPLGGEDSRGEARA